MFSYVFKKSSTFKIFKGPVKQSTKKLHGLLVDRLTLSSTLVLASKEIWPVHEFKGIQDSTGFCISRSKIPDSRYWIPVFVSGTWIVDCNRLWSSGFQSPGFRIPQAIFFF